MDEDYIVKTIKSAQSSPGLEYSYLNMLIRFIHSSDIGSEIPSGTLCDNNFEAKSFFISLILDTPLSDENRDKVLASFGLLDGFQDDENLTARRKHYLIEREKYNPAYIKGTPFTELSDDAQKDRIGGINRIRAYVKIARFLNSHPNRMDYINTARKRHIRTVNGEISVVFPLPSYMSRGLLESPNEHLDPSTVSLELLNSEKLSNDRLQPLSDDYRKRLFSDLKNDIDEKLQEGADQKSVLSTRDEPEAQFLLGITFIKQGDYKKAELQLLLAANQGYTRAKSYLCLIYYNIIPDNCK